MQMRSGFNWILVSGLLLANLPFGWAQTQSHAVVVKAARHALAPPLSQMAPLPPAPGGRPDDDRRFSRGPVTPRNMQQDEALQNSADTFPLAGLNPLSANPGLNFLGLGTGFNNNTYTTQAYVPDTNIAVGPTQVVQFVNESFVVFNKSDGSVAYGPADASTLWQPLGVPCSTTNLDEIAQFDKLANRWVMLMPNFTGTPIVLCVAVSKTSDAVNGGWNLYQFQPPTSTGCNCVPTPDYPKLAVWPDGYYVSFNEGNGGVYIGAEACALDRNSMLN